MRLYQVENGPRVKALVLAESAEQAVRLIDGNGHGEITGEDWSSRQCRAEEVEMDEVAILFVDYNAYAPNDDRSWDADCGNV